MEILGWVLIALGFFGLLGVGLVLFPASVAWANGALIFLGTYLGFGHRRHGS